MGAPCSVLGSALQLDPATMPVSALVLIASYLHAATEGDVGEVLMVGGGGRPGKTKSAIQWSNMLTPDSWIPGQKAKVAGKRPKTLGEIKKKMLSLEQQRHARLARAEAVLAADKRAYSKVVKEVKADELKDEHLEQIVNAGKRLGYQSSGWTKPVLYEKSIIDKKLSREEHRERMFQLQIKSYRERKHS